MAAEGEGIQIRLQLTCIEQAALRLASAGAELQFQLCGSHSGEHQQLLMLLACQLALARVNHTQRAGNAGLRCAHRYAGDEARGQTGERGVTELNLRKSSMLDQLRHTIGRCWSLLTQRKRLRDMTAVDATRCKYA